MEGLMGKNFNIYGMGWFVVGIALVLATLLSIF
jgi:hypothetical protein